SGCRPAVAIRPTVGSTSLPVYSSWAAQGRGRIGPCAERQPRTPRARGPASARGSAGTGARGGGGRRRGDHRVVPPVGLPPGVRTEPGELPGPADFDAHEATRPGQGPVGEAAGVPEAEGDRLVSARRQ